MRELKLLLQQHLQTPEGKASVGKLSDTLTFGILEVVLKALHEAAEKLPDDEGAALKRALQRLTPSKQ